MLYKFIKYNLNMRIKDNIDIDNIEVGVIVARFQVHELHEGHKDLIDEVCKNHNMVIIFLGIPVIQGTNKNPLDFSARKSMVQEYAPDAIILPLKDQRSNAKWSYLLDNQISIPFGERSAVIYGSRDSFIPYYEGKYPTLELETNVYTSGTEVRKNVSKQLLSSSDFRAGIIQSTYMRRPTTWSTVDVCPYDSKGRILLGKKPNESVWRFIGGFLDRTDKSDESAAKRELIEEAGAIETGPMEYVTSKQIDDWRYEKIEDGIMTRLFITKFQWGAIEPSDDISELKWFPIETFRDHNSVTNLIMSEHQELMRILIKNKLNTIKNG